MLTLYQVYVCFNSSSSFYPSFYFFLYYNQFIIFFLCFWCICIFLYLIYDIFLYSKYLDTFLYSLLIFLKFCFSHFGPWYIRNWFLYLIWNRDQTFTFPHMEKLHILAPFMEYTLLCPLIWFTSTIIYQASICVLSVPGLSVLFHSSLCQSPCQHYTLL